MRGGEFLGAENFPLPLFNPLHAGVARPIFFFWGRNKYSFLRVSVRLLEPPQGRLGIQYLLLRHNSNNYWEFKGY